MSSYPVTPTEADESMRQCRAGANAANLTIWLLYVAFCIYMHPHWYTGQYVIFNIPAHVVTLYFRLKFYMSTKRIWLTVMYFTKNRMCLNLITPFMNYLTTVQNWLVFQTNPTYAKIIIFQTKHKIPHSSVLGHTAYSPYVRVYIECKCKIKACTQNTNWQT